MTSRTIDAIVGAHLRDFRANWGYSYTQIADAARVFGARWGSSGVRAIERGEAALTLDKLIVLALTTRKLTGEAVTLANLVATDTAIDIGDKRSPGMTVEPAWLLDVLQGSEIIPPMRGNEVSFHAASGTFRLSESRQGDDPSADMGSGFEVVIPTSAEQRVAAKLDISPMALSWAARYLWKRSLDEEARQRAGEAATPQARGRVTRILTQELAAHLEQHPPRTTEDG